MRALVRLVPVGLVLVFANLAPASEKVRYFAVWSYVENVLTQEIASDQLEGRSLGYWELKFDEGGVERATYRGTGGARWLSFRYVEEEGRVFADLYGAEGNFISRKNTNLEDRQPRMRAP